MSDTEHAEPTEPHVPTAAEIAEGMSLDPGAMLVQAVIQSFWNPVPTGYSMEPNQYGGGMNGMPMMVPVPQYGPSPLSRLAQVLFQASGEKIMAKVAAEIDVDALAERIAADVYDKLSKEPEGTFGARDRTTPTTQRVRSLVEKLVSEKLSDQVQADYNAQQQAMLAAWHEKVERDRNRGQLYAGKTVDS